MSGGTALCLACGTGEICDQAKSVEKMRSGGEDFELEHGYAVPECRTIAIADADRVVTEVAPVSAWAIKASLDPENLKRGLSRSQRAPVGPRTVKERRMRKGEEGRARRRNKIVKERKPARVAAVKECQPEEVVMEKTMTKEEAKLEAVRLAPTKAEKKGGKPKVKVAARKAAVKKAGKPVKKLSPAGRKQIAAAMKKRWVARKKASG